jgi:undecaprenyl-diphosphatase
VISYVQAAILGLLQGVTEPFPISSLGHGVILPRVLGWDIHQDDPFFLSFLVATHLATALVLLGFFWADWKRILAGLWRSVRERGIRADDTDAILGWLLVTGTVPVGIIGLLAEKPLRSLFASPAAAAAFLVVNGLMLLAAERLRSRAPALPPVADGDASDPDARLARLSWRQAAAIGTAQAIGLVPGMSRSGATMSAGLLAGLDNEDAARFAFLLATPIIGAAAVLKLPDLLGPDGDGVRGPAALGAVCAAITTYLAVKFLLRFFQSNRLTPFGVYCVAAGAVLTLAFAAGA